MVNDPPRRGLGVLAPPIRLPADYARLPALKELAADGIAGFVVFGGDDELLPPFLASLREAAGRPLLIMSDVERGVGQQVQGCVHLPSAMAIGATCSEEWAYQHGTITAVEARGMGINMLLAPVADVLSRPTNPILGNRSFGANPDLVARLTAAWVTGAQEQGVLACAKHFPGHGDTIEDSHVTLPRVMATSALLRARDLKPFRAAIRAGVGAVMSAHVAYPLFSASGDRVDPEESALPATLRRSLLVDVLRGELGFGGLVLADALNMKGIQMALGADGEPLPEPELGVRCVAAGCDILLHPKRPRDVARALEEADDAGRIQLASVEARLRLTLADLAAEYPVAPTLRAEHLFAAQQLARESLTVLHDDAGLLPLDLAPAARVMAILVDDDDDPRREIPFRERTADLSGGFVRRTRWEGDDEDRAILSLAAGADLVLLTVASSTRAWKGRAEIAPDLARLVTDVLRVARGRCVCLLLGAPGALDAIRPAPPTLVAAWGTSLVSARVATDAILAGHPLRGLDPAP